MLTSKRYDLEGFAEYAHHLSDCQTFHKSEAKHIDYVLRVHSTLRRNGVKVPQEDEVCSNQLLYDIVIIMIIYVHVQHKEYVWRLCPHFPIFSFKIERPLVFCTQLA